MVNCQNQFGSDNTGKLFEPKDSSTNDQVIEFAKRIILPSTVNLHIGLNDIAAEGTWQYATGGNLVYTNWDNGQPDNYKGVEDCGETWTGTTWNDGPCSGKQPSICEMISIGMYNNVYALRPVHVLISRFYPDFFQTLSRFYPDFI